VQRKEKKYLKKKMLRATDEEDSIQLDAKEEDQTAVDNNNIDNKDDNDDDDTDNIMKATSALFLSSSASLSSSNHQHHQQQHRNHHQQQQETNLMALRIKSFKDVNIQIYDGSSVGQVKQAVRSALGEEAKDRYLRLICKGRLLAPDTSRLNEFPVSDGDVLHAVLAAAGMRGGQQAALARALATTTTNNNNNTTTGTTGSSSVSRRYRGTGLGPGGRAVRTNHGNNNNSNSSDDDNDDNNHDASDGSDLDGDEEVGRSRERLGFDRLRNAGMSRGEITAIRSYFSRHVDRFVQTRPELAAEAAAAAASGETDRRRRRLLHEDAWMTTQGPTSEFRFNLNQNINQSPLLRLSAGAGSPSLRPGTVGSDRDFLWGFLLGFLVGFLMLVYVWVPTVPHKQKLGILAGISFQLALNFLKDSGDDVDGFVEEP